MTKINNQSNSLAQIEFVEDIDQEAAANYSGGVGRINDGKNNPDIILYEDANFQGRSIDINAETENGIYNLGKADFNDKTSSFKIIRGTWTLFSDRYEGSSITLGPGSYSGLNPNDNDKITSVRRAGA
jgi:Beta/Gamma crystallin